MADFASACRMLGIERPWGQLKALSELGHVEYSWLGDAGWSCAPPVLALLPGEESIAVACGARAEEMTEALRGEGLTVEPHSQPDGPAVLLVRDSSRSRLRKRANSTGVLCPDEAPAWSLAKVLPPLEQYMKTQLQEIPYPSATAPALWSAEQEHFISRSALNGNGVWQYEDPIRGRRKGYLYIEHGQAWRIGDLDAALLHGRTHNRAFVEYEDKSHRLLWSRKKPLPALYSRALILCSGHLPQKSTEWLEYRNVPPTIAALVLDRLAILREEVVSA